MEKIKDQLSWDEFYKNSKQQVRPITKINAFNRLIVHSKNFFVISGYGAFTKGYMLIITKDFIPSFGLLNDSEHEELFFLIKLIKKIISIQFKKQTVVFEHGMCACIGGLDRAHLHLMGIPRNTKTKDLKKSINRVLFKRKLGIKYVEFKGYKLENVHDINHFFEIEEKNSKTEKKDYKINGEIYSISDIQNLNFNKWPGITLNHINKGGHYVYFNSGNGESSFLTTKNFETQFGREVVFENELNLNKTFKRDMTKIQKNNKFLEIWKWQNFLFEDNILSTLKFSKKGFEELKKEYSKEYKNFKIEII
jgi:diadenosine tetraphosphate (Ap4A) HIT family hydrolase